MEITKPKINASTAEIFQIRAIEIPQYIAVKTRFVTKKASSLLQPSCQLYSLESAQAAAANEQLQKRVKLPRPVLLNAVVKSTPPIAPIHPIHLTKFVDASTITDSPNPLRHRATQSDAPEEKTYATIAIQCDIATELEEKNYFDDVDMDPVENAPTPVNNVESQKQLFEEYVKSNTFGYSNGRVECLLCGEFGKGKAMDRHMAAHYGNRRICMQCGIVPMFRQHKCAARVRTAKEARRRFHCPHFDCRVTTISQLELYDHINEHANLYTYKCRNHCNHTFNTASEFMHHLKMAKVKEGTGSKPKYNLNDRRDRVYRTRVFPIYSHRKRRVHVASFLLIRERHYITHRQCCQICLRYFSNKFQFTKHMKRCRRNFCERKQRKLVGPPKTSEQTSSTITATETTETPTIIEILENPESPMIIEIPETTKSPPIIEIPETTKSPTIIEIPEIAEPPTIIEIPSPADLPLPENLPLTTDLPSPEDPLLIESQYADCHNEV